ncbi:putative arabinosyltransferase ARAD1 [Canna indica]|uniref:Arabinosyltransferase ARAD1 n=1 Tax=Canna indica TaxID=4628 RepID=A0AAQ3QI56_9LILI|nr:putative arabinosyltransferase ARAD1 [Canna indica]
MYRTQDQTRTQTSRNVFVADLPRSLNYGLLDEYWALFAPDSRIDVDPDAGLRHAAASARRKPYPGNPLIKQYSAEYWLLGDLETPERLRESSFAERVFDLDVADVVFIPFFATLSAEMELDRMGEERWVLEEG